ncbi:MAG: magnesium transporter [Gammaproteobacteria bacterium]|nr:magnesium transporter [Gammaproteobacteria bacterium]
MSIETETLGTIIDRVVSYLRNEEGELLQQLIATLPHTEIASLLDALPPEATLALWELLPGKVAAQTLPHLGETSRNTLLDILEEEELIEAAGMMSTTDLANLLNNMPDAQTEQILSHLDDDYRHRLGMVLNFPQGSAGRLMNRDVVSVRKNVTLAVVLRWLRRHNSLPPRTDALMVIDEAGHYLGRLPMDILITSQPELLVEEAMIAGSDVVRADNDGREVAHLFQRRDLASVAVIDESQKLVGRITTDEVMSLLRIEADEQVLKPRGMKESDELFAPILPSAIRRGLWLGINLATVFLAAWVIGRFEAALDQIVALAILLPVVASMGGIAGSQTLALTLLGMTLERIAPANVFWLVRKELAVGLLNGLVWALVVGVVAYLWFGSWGIGLVIAAAMTINLVAAAASGVLVPLTLKRLGADPALSGAVVLTTVTDIVGFLSFLGLATLFLL